jgi:hypothetical protein
MTKESKPKLMEPFSFGDSRDQNIAGHAFVIGCLVGILITIFIM